MGRAEEVMKGLASLRDEDVLCDIQLEAEGQRISAHKAVLAAASPYFKGMFSGKFKETMEEVVPMKEVTFQGLRSVVDCIYTTNITLDMTNIEQVLPAAHLLQMNDIIKECVNWMNTKISTANCLQFLGMAEKFDIEKLESKVNEFILKNFVTVSEIDGFQNVSRPALVRFLACDTLKTNINNEFAAYKAARAWILANEPPAEGVEEIMSCVRFGLIKPNQLMMEILRDPVLQNRRKCQKMIDEAMLYHTNLSAQPLYKGPLNKPRGQGGLLLIPSCKRGEGYNVTDSHASVEFVSFPGLKVSNLNSQLDIPIVYESMSSIQISNFLYVFGVNGKCYQNFAKRYDASVDNWIELAAVPEQALIGPAIANHGKQIYLLGGMKVSRETKFTIEVNNLIDNVYTYDISQNIWSESNALPISSVHSAAAEIQGNIYLTGGAPVDTDEGTLDKVWAYDLKAKIWLTKEPMNHKRCQHSLQAVDDKLFVFGGRLVVNAVTSIKSIEMYDPLANQWTVLVNRASISSGSSSFAIGNKIYLVGGSNNNDTSLSEEVHVYNIEKQKMFKLKGRLPSRCVRNISAFMVLPKLL